MRLLRGWRCGCWRCAGRFSGSGSGVGLLLGDQALLERLGLVALLLGPLRLGAGRRVVADHVELLAHRPQVGGGPVEEHADRERDAADGEHDGQHVEQQLLLLGVGPGQGVLRHVLAHQLALGEERRRGHRQHEEQRPAPIVGAWPSALRNVSEILMSPKSSAAPNCSACSSLRMPLASPFAALLSSAEEREEDRHLQQDRQAGRERVGARVLVELHRLLGETLPVVAVLLLQLLDLGLDQLHVAAGLDLLDEQRDQRRADHQGQADDRQHPGGAALRRPNTRLHTLCQPISTAEMAK